MSLLSRFGGFLNRAVAKNPILAVIAPSIVSTAFAAENPLLTASAALGLGGGMGLSGMISKLSGAGVSGDFGSNISDVSSIYSSFFPEVATGAAVGAAGGVFGGPVGMAGGAVAGAVAAGIGQVMQGDYPFDSGDGGDAGDEGDANVCYDDNDDPYDCDTGDYL